MSEIKMHTRHEWMRKTGKRISRGGWERLNRAYEVHHGRGGTPKLRIVGYETDEETGARVLDKDGLDKPLFLPCLTHVLMRETVKCNRKVSMRDRYVKKDSRRTRYLCEPQGITR